MSWNTQVNAEARALKPTQTHPDASKWHLKYAYMHTLEGRGGEGGKGVPKSTDADAGTHKQAETHAVICCPRQLVGCFCFFFPPASPFMFKAYHVNSASPTRIEGKQHNLCDGVEVKKEKERWQNE